MTNRHLFIRHLGKSLIKENRWRNKEVICRASVTSVCSIAGSIKVIDNISFEIPRKKVGGRVCPRARDRTLIVAAGDSHSSAMNRAGNEELVLSLS